MTFSPPSHVTGQTEGQCFGFIVKRWDMCSERCGILWGGSWKHCACHSLCWHDIVSVLVHDCRSGLATLKHWTQCSVVLDETQFCCLGLYVLGRPSVSPTAISLQSEGALCGLPPLNLSLFTSISANESESQNHTACECQQLNYMGDESEAAHTPRWHFG